MKKLLISLILCFVAICSFGKINTYKAGKNLVVEFYKEMTDSITTEYFIRDYYDAMNIANKRNVKNVLFRDNENNFFYIIKSRKEIKNVDKHLYKLLELIENSSKTEYIQGPIISKHSIKISNAKYRRTTYINGNINDVFETDWDGGYFKTETSTLKYSDGTVIISETKYIPPQYKDEIEYAPGKTIYTPGIIVFGNIIYRY